MENWITRLLIEQSELSIKIVKLKDAIDNKKVPSSQVDILLAQLHAMQAYNRILLQRIEALDIPEE